MNKVKSVTVDVYQVARGLLRGRASKKIGNNTWARLDDNAGAVNIVLHDTAVVSVFEHGAIVLDSGGWRTHTTKDRINEYLGILFRGAAFHWSLYQDAGQWYLARHESGNWQESARYVFADGVTIAGDGLTVSGAAIDNQKEFKAMRRAVKQYAAAFVAALFAGDVPAPGLGDCLYCQLREVDTGLPLGEVLPNAEHLHSHMVEGYFVPSLLARAIELYPVSQAAMWVLSDKWGGTDNNAASFVGDIARDQFTSSIKRYMYHCLGMSA